MRHVHGNLENVSHPPDATTSANRRFPGKPRGYVAVSTALSAIPIISAIGCVVDYSMATMIKTKLQAAADAATLAAVSANSPIVATAKSMTGNGTITGGQTYTQNFFDFELE